MPYVNVWIDNDEVIEKTDDNDLIEALKSRGYSCYKDGSSSDNVFASVEHLLDCGMIDAAEQEALRIVGKIIGKML